MKQKYPYVVGVLIMSVLSIILVQYGLDVLHRWDILIIQITPFIIGIGCYAADHVFEEIRVGRQTAVWFIGFASVCFAIGYYAPQSAIFNTHSISAKTIQSMGFIPYIGGAMYMVAFYMSSILLLANSLTRLFAGVWGTRIMESYKQRMLSGKSL